MTKYREILRLKSLNLSQQNIAHSCNVSKKTVNRVLKRAEELGISWPLDENDTDAVLAEKFFPSAKQTTSTKRMPDYDYIRKELLRNGVTKKLLWTEYLEDCRANGAEPLMYSQFCYHIQQDEYYGAAEPPVRCGESHLSGLTEPPQFVYLVTLPLLDPVHILLS